jgi:hypothetical protein
LGELESGLLPKEKESEEEWLRRIPSWGKAIYYRRKKRAE